MNKYDELDHLNRMVHRELEAQAERLKVRKVIARRSDGIDEVLNIIQIATDDGVVVYVEAPRAEGEAPNAGETCRLCGEMKPIPRPVLPSWTCCAYRHVRCKDSCQSGEPKCYPMSGECYLAETEGDHKRIGMNKERP